jgi:hypothetical protein
MQQLLIKYRFTEFPYIVADVNGNFYQLPNCEGKYKKKFRKLNVILNNGITEGYRINRNFISLKQLRKQAYVSNEIINIDDTDVPF